MFPVFSAFSSTPTTCSWLATSLTTRGRYFSTHGACALARCGGVASASTMVASATHRVRASVRPAVVGVV